MKYTRGDTSKTERRGREIQLLLNIIEPDPEYQASIFDDAVTSLDVSSRSKAGVQARLEYYFGCSLRGMMTMPMWKLVDALAKRFPGWPESRSFQRLRKAKPDPEHEPSTRRYVIGRGQEARENARRVLATVRGRPRNDSNNQGSRAKSLRLPDATWADLETCSKARDMTVHRLVRVLIAERLYTQTWDERQQAIKRERKAGKAKPVKRARKPTT